MLPDGTLFVVDENDPLSGMPDDEDEEEDLMRAPRRPVAGRKVGATVAPPEVAQMLKQNAGEGVSHKVTDRAFWLDVDPRAEPWIEALAAIDERGDKEPLLSLLRSDAELTRDARHHLAHLLERYQMARRRGGRMPPSYDRSPKEAMIALAEIDHDDLRCNIDRVRKIVRGLARGGMEEA